jgi:PKD repeat protein
MYYSFWTFGDGAYSNEQNPVHEYSTPGTYNVCLNIITPDSCNDTYCETITVGGGATTYSVSGNVYAGGALVSNAAVLLLGNTGSIYAETVYNGYYQFLNVPVGTYIIYAIPSYILYPNYIPTYYESSLFWLDAVEIQVNSDVTGADINLIGFNWSANGIGTITGYIIWNDTTSTNTYKDRPGNSVEDITILLMDLDDNVITFTSTDADGYFEFKTLPFGTYKVYTELTGHITYPAIITLDENNYTVTDIEIIVNGSTIIVGIDNIPGTNAGNVIVFPNPVNDLLNLKIQTDEASRLGLSVVNTLGQTIYSESISVNRGSQIHTINVDKLPKGLYFVRIENKNNQSYLVKFVK